MAQAASQGAVLGAGRAEARRAQCACASGRGGGRVQAEPSVLKARQRRPAARLAVRRRELSPLVRRLGVGAAWLCGCVRRWRRVSDTMNGFSSEERAAPFTLEYRVFLSEWRRRAARPLIHSRPLGASGRAGPLPSPPASGRWRARRGPPSQYPPRSLPPTHPNLGHVGRETTESP